MGELVRKWLQKGQKIGNLFFGLFIININYKKMGNFDKKEGVFDVDVEYISKGVK